MVPIQPLVQQTNAEDNTIATTEAAIRNTVNTLLALLKTSDVKNRSKFKQYSTIHNYFISITMTDCKNLKEIAKLARIVNIDNRTQNYITEINEVLNESDKSNESNDDDNKYVTKYIETFIEKLKYLKEVYVSKQNSIINTEILKYLDKEPKTLLNITDDNNDSVSEIIDESNENILSDRQLWNTSARRINHGIRTRIKDFPFMASVQFFRKFQCAGSIIKSDLVITSSSCLQLAWNNRFYRETPAFLSVQVGSDFYEFGGENIAVLEIYFHPSYDPSTLRNNLAIMRLTRRLHFKKNSKRIQKINIDRVAMRLPNTTPKITVVGWGATDSSNIIYDIYRNKLSYSDLDFYPLRECRELYSKKYVTKKNFCAGFFSRGSGACNRDAGGPGIIGNTLVGVISFGSPICGAPDSPTVFTKLGFYTDWIEEIMDQVVPTTYKRTTTNTPLSFIADYQETTTEKRLTPIMGSTTLKYDPIHNVDQLRMVPEDRFKDFLTTMFKSEEVQEYYDKPNAGNKERKPESKIALQTTPSTTKKPIVRTTTGSHSKFTVLAGISDDDEIVDETSEDVSNVIESLEIYNEASKKSPLKQKPEPSKKNKVKELIKEESSKSREDTDSPKKQTVLSLLFLSKEDKTKVKEDEDEGLSIPAEAFGDFILRHKPNNTNTQDFLSEKAWVDLISQAIDDEAKGSFNGKRYLL